MEVKSMVTNVTGDNLWGNLPLEGFVTEYWKMKYKISVEIFQFATNQIGSLVPLQVQPHSVQSWWCISDGLLHLKYIRPWHYWIVMAKIITKMPHRVPKGDKGLIKWAGERVPYPSLTLGVDCKREGWSRYRWQTLVSILTTPHWPKHSTQKSCVKLKHRHRRNVTSHHSFSLLWQF